MLATGFNICYCLANVIVGWIKTIAFTHTWWQQAIIPPHLWAADISNKIILDLYTVRRTQTVPFFQDANQTVMYSLAQIKMPYET